MKQFYLFAYLLLLGTIGTLQAQDPKRFHSEVQEFKKQDSIAFPPKKSILFVGSSSIRLWKDLKEDLAGFGYIINRGFGGSVLSDAVYYADDIILPYDVKAIFIYSGENDIPNAIKSENDILNDFKSLHNKIRSKKPVIPIIYISMKPSVSRAKFQDKVVKSNALIKAFLQNDKNSNFADIYFKMLDTSGKPNPALFIEDNLHMNKKGYQIWIDALKPYLKKYK